jgi:hypothetical protein
LPEANLLDFMNFKTDEASVGPGYNFLPNESRRVLASGLEGTAFENDKKSFLGRFYHE